VVAVAGNKRHRGAIERALHNANGGKPLERFTLLDFDTVHDVTFDWKSAIALPV
jgi:hypothetical protein